MNKPLAATIELPTSSTSTIKFIASCIIGNFIFDDSLFLEKIMCIVIKNIVFIFTTI